MKVFVPCLISCLVSVAGATAANYYLMQHVGEGKRSDAQIEDELAGINDDLDRLNEFLSMARSDTMRIYHYVAGHRSFSKDGARAQLYCPECGLIVDLENRQTDLDNKLASLSEKMAELRKDNKTETQEFKDGVAEINRINEEVNLLQKHLFARAAMEKDVSTTTNTPRTVEPQKRDEAPKSGEASRPDGSPADERKPDSPPATEKK